MKREMPTPSGPFQIRATILADIVRALAHTRPDLVPPTTARILATTPPDHWLPGALLLDVYSFVMRRDDGAQILGDMARRAAWFCDAGAYFAKVREQALRFARLSPALLFRCVPGGRAMALRNCGTATFQALERGCRITIIDVPPDVSQHPGFAAATRGSFLGVLDLANHAGDVVVTTTDRTMTYEARWWPATQEHTQSVRAHSAAAQHQQPSIR
jgi:hypothetical protein